MELNQKWVVEVITHDDNSHRFETFCAATISHITGHSVVPTSKSHDLGRDGRGITGADSIFVAATLRSDRKKPVDDCKRLTEFVKPDTLYTCFSATISEDFVEKVKNDIRDFARIKHILGVEVQRLMESLAV